MNDADGSDATVDRADIVLATTCFAAIRQKTSANLPQLKRSPTDSNICHTHPPDDRKQRVSISLVSQQNSLANH
ncbi:hypothetical protein AVDCRST_MAG94-781 [uncultured Leptolyngbya sp.]|uniref:Uncharacterized protein n=1 Tax=uncultured Leptolyngbya sp. TaxID=332963 RepID=A0A6J4KJP2_9CYAN|nr:hypothetical protein AVDCRST_MAG94-781 [uncultured Leptolyngbya sp.]